LYNIKLTVLDAILFVLPHPHNHFSTFEQLNEFTTKSFSRTHSPYTPHQTKSTSTTNRVMASIKASVNRYAALDTGSLASLVQLRGLSAKGEEKQLLERVSAQDKKTGTEQVEIKDQRSVTDEEGWKPVRKSKKQKSKQKNKATSSEGGDDKVVNEPGCPEGGDVDGTSASMPAIHDAVASKMEDEKVKSEASQEVVAAKSSGGTAAVSVEQNAASVNDQDKQKKKRKRGKKGGKEVNKKGASAGEDGQDGSIDEDPTQAQEPTMKETVEPAEVVGISDHAASDREPAAEPSPPVAPVEVESPVDLQIMLDLDQMDTDDVFEETLAALPPKVPAVEVADVTEPLSQLHDSTWEMPKKKADKLRTPSDSSDPAGSDELSGDEDEDVSVPMPGERHDTLSKHTCNGATRG
jgi:hypothetical protein